MYMLGPIVTSLVTTVAVVSLMALHTGLHLLDSNIVESSCRETWNTFNMALVSRGINPIYVHSQLSTVAGWTIEKPLTTISCKTQEGKSIVSLISDGGHEGRFAGFGICIDMTKHLPFKQHTSELNPPNIRLSGEIHESWFPINNLMIPASENPSGTYYHYTTNGLEPDENSPIWLNPAVNIEDVPSEIAFKAYHADSIYIPSQTIKATYTLPQPIILMGRESGSASNEVTHSEITYGHNRIVISLKEYVPFYQLEYGFGDDPLWKKYTQPFHIPLEYWKSQTMTIHCRAISKISALPKIFTGSFVVFAKKTKLPTPSLTPGSHEALSNDDWVSAINNTTYGAIHMQSGNSQWKPTSTIQIKYAQ